MYDSGQQSSGFVSLWFGWTEVILSENGIHNVFPPGATMPRVNKTVKQAIKEKRPQFRKVAD